MRRDAAFSPVRAFLPPSFWGRRHQYFAHGVEFNTLEASAVAQQAQFRIDSTSDFLCTDIAMVITTDAAAGTEQAFPEMTAQVSAESGGSFWGSGFQHAGNLFGRMTNTGLGPFTLPVGQLCQAGDTIIVTLNNLEATARRVWLTFHGVKIYRDRWESPR